MIAIAPPQTRSLQGREDVSRFPLRKIGVMAVVWGSLALVGCAKEPPAQPVAPVTVQVVGSDFCEIMDEVARKSGRSDKKLGWRIGDTPQTIHGVRSLARAVDQRCVPPPPTAKPAS